MVMMKHLQDPVPSVLDERDDLPASIGLVVSRAMAKVPDNRYQTVADLIEDLTIAAGMTINLPPLTTAPESSVSQVQDDLDEVTVVRPRPDEVVTPRRAPVTGPINAMPAPPPASSSFSPLKILIPSAVALLVVFVAIYALTSRQEPTNNANSNQQQTLAADPNSQPGEACAPPTGKGEEGIPSGGTITPTVNANANLNVTQRCHQLR